ncbi:MAG: DUF296 domain-containing protein [Deltaproteobacteria bacterium]|nr:DUF296 domain-containing protein [Deltaproteobacteria bacterium]
MSHARTPYYESGSFGRVIAARLLPGTDITLGIEEISRETNIRAAAVQVCIGAVTEASVMIAVPRRDSRTGVGYGEPLSIPGPLSILSVKGVVSEKAGGGIFVHLHGVFSDSKGTVWGGHLVRGRNIVVNTCDLVLDEIKELSLVQKYDPELGWAVVFPEKEATRAGS